MCKVLGICVTYNSNRDVLKFLRSALSLREANQLHIVVVDNAGSISADEKAAYERDPRVDFVNPGRNLGYFGGADHGLAWYLKQHDIPDWVAIANSDLEFADAAFVSKLIQYPVGSGVLVLAPAIRSRLTGADQNPYMLRRPSCLRMQAYKWLYRWYTVYLFIEMLSRLLKRISATSVCRSVRPRRTSPREIYAPHGSLMILHKTYFTRGGSLKCPMFLFNEEIFVAETARSIGATVLYEPRLQVIHREHVSTGVDKSRQIVLYVADAARYCADVYFRFGHGTAGADTSRRSRKEGSV